MRQHPLFFALIFLLPSFAAAQQATVNWVSFEEAVAGAKADNKKILVDFYTSWCGWCKVMDNKTYANPEVAEYINQNYHAVKFNAEGRDTVEFNGKVFGYVESLRCHQLAYSMLNGKMGYPSTVFLNEKAEILSPVAGYIEAEQMSRILRYYGENFHEKMSWSDFEKQEEK